MKGWRFSPPALFLCPGLRQQCRGNDLDDLPHLLDDVSSHLQERAEEDVEELHTGTYRRLPRTLPATKAEALYLI